MNGRQVLLKQYGRAIVGPISISVAGKIASAIRDISPVVFFGIGDRLDLSVLAALVGSMLASIAITTAVPLCLPLLAIGDDRSKTVMGRFLMVFTLLGAAAIFFATGILRLLGAEEGRSDVQLLYRAAILAGVIQVATSLMSVRLYALQASNLGLAMPLFAGATVPFFLWCNTSLTALAVALVVGGVLDFVLMLLVVIRKGGAKHRATSEPRGSNRVQFEFLAASQIMLLCIVFGERALMSRGGVGVVGTVSIAARVSTAAAGLIAGSMEPQIVRHVAALGGRASSSLHRLARTTVLTGIGSVVLCICTFGVIIATGASVPVAAGVLYLACTPAMVFYRFARATLFGRQAYASELWLMIVGGAITISIALAAHLTNVAVLFALSVPLSSSILAIAIGSVGSRSEREPTGGKPAAGVKRVGAVGSSEE